MPLEGSDRQSADQQQLPGDGEPADEQPDAPEVEPADDGLDWLREHIAARAAGGVIGAGGPLPPLAGQPTPSHADDPPAVEAPAVRRLRETSAALDEFD